jgi:hypothetical protein
MPMGEHVTRIICRRLAFLALALLPPWTAAHHSVAEFDLDHPITLNATVKEVWFSNPHIRYYVTVTGENGVEETWDVHGSSVTSLARRGWSKDTIKVGDKIQVNGSPNRKGIKRVLIRNIVLSDGKMLGSPAEPGERRPQ